MSQDPGATRPAVVELDADELDVDELDADEAKAKATDCSELDKFVSSITYLRPKLRKELDDISAKLLEDGKSFANTNEKNNLQKAFKTLEITESIQEQLGQYATKVYKYPCKNDSKNYLVLWGDPSTLGSFMPTFALEDAGDVFSETVHNEIMVPLPEDVKSQVSKEVLEVHATIFSKTYSIARSFVLWYMQSEDPSLADVLLEQFEALSSKDGRKSWSDFRHFGADESFYTKSALEHAKQPKESLKDVLAQRHARISELEAKNSELVATNSSLDRQNDLYLDVICELALRKMWLSLPDALDCTKNALDCAKNVVLCIGSIVGKDKVHRLLSSPDSTRELVFIRPSGEAINPKTLLDFMALCVDLESHQVDAHVLEWLQLDIRFSIPCIDVAFAFQVCLMFLAVPSKENVHTNEFKSFVKFLGARLRAFD